MSWFYKRLRKAPTRCTTVLRVEGLEDRATPAVTTADVPLATSFGMPIGDSNAADVSKLSIGTFPNSGYPKIRFNDDGDSSAEAGEWYVATAHNHKRWLSGGWNSDSTGIYGYGGDSYQDAHPGEDWNLTAGGSNAEKVQQQPVTAIADGVVLYKGWAYGNTLIVAHRLSSGEIITSFYGHLDSTLVAEGTRVTKGAKIGVVGDSGATGVAHLHFELRKQSMITINPSTSVITLTYLPGMWPPSTKQVNGDGGSTFIANNYYTPSQFIKSNAPTAVTLQNDVAVGTFSGAVNSQRLFKITVPSGQSSLRIEMYGGSGDADLYVRRGSPPTLTSYDHRPYLGGNAETVTITNPAAGDYFIMLHGYSSYSNVMLRARYGSSVRVLQQNVALTDLAGTRNSQTQFQFTVPSGAKSVTFVLSGGAGDADLYVRRGSMPTLTSWDHRPYRSGNNETVTISYPAAGTYFIMLHGYSDFAGVTLKAYYTF